MTGHTPQETSHSNTLRHAAAGLLAVICWLAVYSFLEAAANRLTFTLAGFDPESPSGQAIAFFLYDTAKIFMLLAAMVYAVSWLRAGLDAERIRRWLTGKPRIAGYALAALFGAITPFCSCSSVPLFIGFVTGGLPIGLTMTFLITSPIINEIAIVMLWDMMGWPFTALYILTGLFAGLAGGLLMDKLSAGRWLQPFLLQAIQNRILPSDNDAPQARLTLAIRHAFAIQETKTIFRRVWLWVIIGVAIGAVLHGYVPQDWFTEHLGTGQWWSVPAAVAAGIPLYANVTGIIPVLGSLLSKGMPPGTALALCMSTVAISLPEILMLRKAMRLPLLAWFIGWLLACFTLAGWLLNFFSHLFF